MCSSHSQYPKKAQAKQTNVTWEGLARSGWGGPADVASLSRTYAFDRFDHPRLKEYHRKASRKTLLNTVTKLQQELEELKEVIHYMQGVQDVQNQTIERLLSVHTLYAEVADLEEGHEDVTSSPEDEFLA